LKNLPILFTDLDQTLIYSHRQATKTRSALTGTVCVEEYENRPLSYLSLQAWQMMVKHHTEMFNIIPVTTRTLRQYRRVQFPNLRFRYAVVLNGARILVDGVEDHKWTKKVAAEVKRLDTHPVHLWEQLTHHLAGHPEVTRVTSADDFFPYIVSPTQSTPELDEYTHEMALKTGYIRSKQGRKTYLIPPNLSKGTAVKELTRKLKPEITVAAGDSVLDFTMEPVTDHFIQPAHGDLTPASEHYRKTEHHGIKAAEDILNFMVNTAG